MQRFPFGDDAADQLLSGRLPADAVPESHRGVAWLFGAATAAATPAELANAQSISASAAAAVQQSVPTPFTPPSPKHRLQKLLTAKAAAVATALAFGLGTAAAAATGSIPGQSHANHHAAAGLANAAKHGSHATTTSSSVSPSPTTATSASSLPTSGTANVHAQFGLCTAFLNGQKQHGPTTSSTVSTSTTSLPPQYSSDAFKALMAEHGGVGGTTTYCQNLVATQHPGANPTGNPNSHGGTGGGKPSTPPTTGPHHPSGGKPANAGPPTSVPGKGSSH